MRHRFMTAAAAALLASSMLGLAGCGGGDNLPPTHPVSGTVTQDGTPVADATVTFVPDGGDGKSAVATTDDSGTYQLTTFKNGDGAMTGSYKVKVVKYETSGDEPARADAASADAVDEEEAYIPPEDQEPAPADTGPNNLLPEQYADPDESGLQYTVEEGENTYDIALDS